MRSCTRTNCSPMTWRFNSGSRTSSSGARNSASQRAMSTTPEPNRRKRTLDEFGLTFAHEAGIDVDAAHARRAESPQTKRERDGGIDPAADEEEDIAIADRAADLLLDQRDATPGIPVLFAIADIEDEVFENARALRGVDDLGVELHAIEPARADLRLRRSRRWMSSPARGSRTAQPSRYRGGTSRSVDDRVRRRGCGNRCSRSDRGWQGRIHPYRLAAQSRRAAAQSAAAHSRYPERACRSLRRPPSMVGLDSS